LAEPQTGCFWKFARSVTGNVKTISRPKPKRLARETISIFFATVKEDKINGR
jgi:hypothetical protein